MNKLMYIAPMLIGLVAVSDAALSQAKKKSNLGLTPPTANFVSDISELSTDISTSFDKARPVIDGLVGKIDSELDGVYAKFPEYGASIQSFITTKCDPDPKKYDPVSCDMSKDSVKADVKALQTAVTQYYKDIKLLPDEKTITDAANAIQKAVDSLDVDDQAALKKLVDSINAAEKAINADIEAIATQMGKISSDSAGNAK